MLVTIAEFLELKFTPKSRPSAHSVRKWIKRREFPYPVQRLGGRWYIELDPEEKKTEVDPLFLKIIQGGDAKRKERRLEREDNAK